MLTNSVEFPKDILIGFTIAGFVAVLVPTHFWETLFLTEATHLPNWLIVIENAMIAPFVAALTFIGSMGNIPLATVLESNGVLFAGIMGFIYSDLMVPPLVHINAKYYGWRVALYIAGIMFVSIVITALTLNGIFTYLDIIPESERVVSDITQFKIDYTFWLNLVFIAVAGWSVWANKSYLDDHSMKMMPMEGSGKIKMIAVWTCILLLTVGMLLFIF